MKTQVKLFFIVLLISGTLGQKLIFSSDEKVEITIGDSFSGSRSGSGSGSVSGGSSGGSGGSSSGGSSSGGKGRVQIFGSGGFSGFRGKPQDSPKSSQFSQSSQSSSSSATYARFAEPTGEALALRSKLGASLQVRAGSAFGGSGSGSGPSARLQQSLSSARWIAGTGLGSKKVVYWTPCFYNSCPDGVFTIDIQATCDFTAYLVDEWGNIVSVIGSGQGWGQYSFNFTAGCGRYRVKIVLDCSCGCAHVCFNLYQDQQNCFKCPDSLNHTYNAETCQCECASTCTNCASPQKWNDFPKCSCTCPFILNCPDGQIFDRKECRCKCLPTCCSCDTC